MRDPGQVIALPSQALASLLEVKRPLQALVLLTASDPHLREPRCWLILDFELTGLGPEKTLVCF